MATTANTAVKKVLLVGAGFIGWNVLDLLVKDYEVTTLARRKDHASRLEATGAQVVLGSIDDRELLVNLSTQHDIVIHAAPIDNVVCAEALCEGVKERAKKGQSTIYIHTSGTTVIGDLEAGGKKSSRLYSDDRPEDIDALPDSAPHRAIDLKALALQRETGAKVAIIIPPLVYGYNQHHGRLSVQIPTLTRFALKHGYAGYVGEGDAVWSLVHVEDLARAYLLIIRHLENARDVPNPYYFCESTGEDEVSWKAIAATIGTALHQAGRIADPTPRQIPKDQYGDLFGAFSEVVLGINSRCRAKRVRNLGWKPVAKSWASSFVEDELPVILEEDANTFSGYTTALPAK